VVKALNAHAKFLRGVLGRSIDMKFTPALKFVHDETFNVASHMNALFEDPGSPRICAGCPTSRTRTEMARRKKGDAVSGWICLDKPYDLTSTHAVSRVRRAFNAQKAGHAGTLDPLATGILPIALGEATKTVPFLVDADKTYRFVIEWAAPRRPSIARARPPPAPTSAPAAPPSRPPCQPSSARSARLPPAYSAIKVDGERSYDLARAGQAVELRPGW